MKKLMLVAAVAASMVAVAADCERPTPQTPVLRAAGGVYQLKMSLRTTKGVATFQAGSTTITGGVCTRGTNIVNASGCVYRTADAINVDGWIVECTNTCKSIQSKVIYAWETKRQAQIETPKLDWTLLQIMGAKYTEAEAYAKFSGVLNYNTKQKQQIKELYLAGQGKFAGYYTTLAGNAAGVMTASYDLNPRVADADIACAPSKVWTCDTIATATCDTGKANDTAVYGTWSIKYNSAASQRYFAQGALALPAYVK